MSDHQDLTDREQAHLDRRAEDRAARAGDRQQEDADRAYLRALARRRTGCRCGCDGGDV